MRKGLSLKKLFFFLILFSFLLINLGCSSFSSQKIVSTKKISHQNSLFKKESKVSGCICHSKNPAMVSMHNFLMGTDCFLCHQKGENLMGKRAGDNGNRKLEMERRKKKEVICQKCHLSGSAKKIFKETKISGNLFCSQEGKQYSQEEAIKRGDKFYCPQDKVELININQLADESAKNPRNELCIACHPINSNLEEKHTKVKENSGIARVNNCLQCHQSHTRCGNCHF